jgi:pantetheine-phosphate adenylyltransferase
MLDAFDPLTLGHLDIVKRSYNFCDQLVVAIGINPTKKCLFTEDERKLLIKSSLDEIGASVTDVVTFQGLIVEYAKSIKANILIRGIRSVSDFEYEINLASINKVLAPEIETVFLPTSPDLAVVSSSAAKEICKLGGNISKFVTPQVASALELKFGIFHGVAKKCPICCKTDTLKPTEDLPSFIYCRNCGVVV